MATIYRGYRITQGAYHGTTDNRAGRYYIAPETEFLIDLRGAGFASIADAKGAIDQLLEELEIMDRLDRSIA